MTNQLQLDLFNAGDTAERDTLMVRRAQPGDQCCFCDVPFKDGERIDRLFVAHLTCYDENVGNGETYNG